MAVAISYFEVRAIFDTLPVGYYVKRDVKRELSETETRSYYIPTEDRLVVSYKMIAEAVANIEKTELTDETKEMVIRTLLYHEVSHAFITPRDLLRCTLGNWSRGQDIMNIFEDERIESALRKYYLNVNFRKLVYLISGDPYKILENPKCSARNAFYVLCRYRICDEKAFLNELSTLIQKFRDMRKWKSSWSNYGIDCYRYVCTIRDFYERFETWWNSKKEAEETKNDETENTMNKNAMSQNGEGAGNSDNMENSQNITENNKTNNTNGNNENNENETENSENLKSETNSGEETKETEDDKTESGSETEEPSDADYETEYDDNEFVNGLPEELFVDTADKYFNKELENTLNVIINNNKKINKRNAGSINAYSGVFDPRSVARDDYKYFVQANRAGHTKMYSKTNINLFIDRSGSFLGSQEKINQLIGCLARIERTNPDFSFNLITMGEGDRIEPKNSREVKCSGGNWLKKDIFDIFKKVQNPGTSNYNIVCFDGDAYTDCPYGRRDVEYANFRAFDTNNTVIISDSDNKRYIERYCKHSKNIFTKNYVDELFKNVTTAMTVLFR